MKENISKALCLCFGYTLAELLVAGLNLIPASEVILNYKGKEDFYSCKHQMFYHLQKEDDYLGFINASNLNEKYTSFGLDFRYNTDKDGFRNKHDRTENQNISVVGDSFAYSFGVNLEDSFPQLMEDLLGVNISNFGVTGYAPWQYNKVMKMFPSQFKDTIILYCVYSNDFVPESASIAERYYKETGRVLFSSDSPSFWELVDVTAGRKSFLKKTFSYQLYRKLFLGGEITTISNERYLVRGENEIKDAWLSEQNQNQLFDVFGEAVDISREYHSKLVVVLFPSRARTYQKYYEAAFSDEESVPLEERAYQLAKQYFAQRGVESIDLADVLKREAVSGTPVYLNFDAHLNKRGNKTVAREISCYLIEHGYIDPTKTITNICTEESVKTTTSFVPGIIYLDKIDF